MPRLLLRTLIVLACAAATMAGEAVRELQAPAGAEVLAAGVAPSLLGDGAASIRLVRRGQGMGLVRVEDARVADRDGAMVIRRREMVGDHLLVSLKPGADPALLARDLGGGMRGRAGRQGPWRLAVPVRGHQDLPDLRSRLLRDPRVASVGPDWIVQPIGGPDDPYYGQLWGMSNSGQTGGTPDADIDAAEAWDISTGSRDVLVGIIDTGVDRSHPDLAANMWSNPGETGTDGSGGDKRSNGIDDDGNGFIDDWRGWDFVNGDNDPDDDQGHGTHVAGTIGAVGGNGTGVTGVCWQVSMVGIKFLGPFGGTTSDAISAIEYATSIGCNLTSNSWGGGGYSQELADAIGQAGAAGRLFVAAAGNSSGNNDLYPVYPASYALPNIIAVAATDHNDALAGFSCYGAVGVDLAAPGVSILSSLPGATYGLYSGTSMATPHVSGACALLWSVAPGLSAAGLKQALLEHSDPLPSLSGKVACGGRLNVHRALLSVAGPQVSAVSLAISEVGNGDGIFSPGETAAITLTLRGSGSATAVGVGGVLTSADGEALIPDGLDTWGDLAVGGTSPGNGGFTITLPSSAATPHDVVATIEVTAASGGPWRFPLTIPFRRSAILSGTVRRLGSLAPVSGAAVACNGPGGGTTTTANDGTWSLGVTDGDYQITATSVGLSQSAAVNVTAPPDRGGIDILLGQPLLEVAPSDLHFVLNQGGSDTATLTASNRGDMRLTGTLRVEADAFAATGLWHAAGHRSEAGTSAWYYGRDDTRTYETGTANHGELTLPPVRLPAEARTATFREWRSAETGGAFDRSQFEYSLDGMNWTLLHQSTTNTSIWREVSVPIDGLAGQMVRFRFTFDTGDAIANSTEGWYIDDVRLDGAPLAGWLAVSPMEIDLQPGASATYAVQATAGSLPPGSYLGTTSFISNDPINPVYLHLTYLDVQGSPVLQYGDLNFDDGQNPPAIGDGDHAAEAGETINLGIGVYNAGQDAATDLQATLTCTDPLVEIISGTAAYPALAAGALGYNQDALTIRIDPDCPIGTTIPLVLTLHDGAGNSWVIGCSLTTSWLGTVSGRISRAGDGLPLAGALVSAGGRAAYTDAYGDYILDGMPPGDHILTASLYGYAPTSGSVSMPPDWIWNAELGSRELVVTPGALGLESNRQQPVAGTLTLSSLGNLPVNWTATAMSAQYRVADSDQPGGPVYSWTDITGSGTQIAIAGDDANVGTFPVGFHFPLYGDSHPTFRVCSNGWISFTSTSSSYSAVTLPSPGAPRSMIAALWADLYIDASASVWYQQTAAGTCIIQYNNVARLGNSSLRATFQIILHADGGITLQYARCDFPAVIGIQDESGTRGEMVPQSAHPGLAIRLQPITSWVGLSATSGTIAAGANDALLVTCDPAGRPSGEQHATIVFSSDDGNTPSLAVPVTLTIRNPSPPVSLSQSLSTACDTALAITLSASDPDGDPVSHAIVIPPVHGTLLGTPPSLTYVPQAGYVGGDAFVASSSDGELDSAPVLILIAVRPIDTGPPVGSPASVGTQEDQPVAIALAASDPDDSPIGWSITTHPAHGTASLAGNVLTYTPEADWNGTDVVMAAPHDLYASGAPVAITIVVTAIDDPPTVAAVSGRVVSGSWIELAVPCSDPDGDTPQLLLVAQPANGSATLSGSGIRFASPAGWTGTAVIPVQAVDPSGLLSPVASVVVTVVPPASEQGSSGGQGGGGGGCGAGALGLALATLGACSLRRRRR